ncbi:MAG TPA: GDP-mannose 4,6-dehydratase, partial [Planctomycetaceae bacterium]|nr:GDP-mannose 4,6-dehydratase [Planctomycetaceae bacterium]
MLQQEEPDDYVLATGESRTIRDLLQVAFDHVGLKWQDYVKIDQRFKRPADAHELLGNPAKAIAKLGWQPTVTFEQLIGLMVDEDLKAVNSQH